MAIICTKCKVPKKEEDFYYRKDGSKLYNHCRKCFAARIAAKKKLKKEQNITSHF